MSSFQNNGYIKVENLIDKQTTKTISQYFENKIRRGEWVAQSKLSGNEASKLWYYADPLIEIMLEQCQPAIEQHTGLLLEPTYSYSRVYQEGEELKPHTDREACEVSATISVAYTGEICPIWMQYKNNDPVKCLLNPGDAVIYKGCETTHWRRPLLNGQLVVQFMLHYVAKNGPNVAYKFDKRESLALDETKRRS
jgi:hypothetical protein